LKNASDMQIESGLSVVMTCIQQQLFDTEAEPWDRDDVEDRMRRLFIPYEAARTIYITWGLGGSILRRRLREKARERVSQHRLLRGSERIGILCRSPVRDRRHGI
jgi:hypothetical protein